MGPTKLRSVAVNGQVAQLVEQRTENPRVGGSIPPLATTIQRPTVLSWAFSLLDPAEHAGFARILRVPGGGQTQCRWLSVRPFSALCSLGISANFFAVAHAHRLA